MGYTWPWAPLKGSDFSLQMCLVETCQQSFCVETLLGRGHEGTFYISWSLESQKGDKEGKGAFQFFSSFLLKLGLVLIRWCKFFRWSLGLRGNIRFYGARHEVVCFVPCLLAAKTTWMWEAVLWSARAVVGQATVSRVIPTTLGCCSLPLSFSFSPSVPSSFYSFSLFPSFSSFLPLSFSSSPGKCQRGWRLSSSLCQSSLTGFGISMLLISLANPFPLLARITPGISKEAVNYVGYSFSCSSL